MDYSSKSLKKHYEWKGKIEVVSRVKVKNKNQLSLAYTPGVAEPCLQIQKDITKSYELTRRWNTIAVISDGTAVLGLGDIGPEASMPVMEGKCVLFKEFGNVDAIPLCVKTKDVDEFVNAVSLISGSFGGINLEDISAPRCFEIEEKLKKCTDIPIFHDDQHGTSIVCIAALINSLKIVNKKIEDCKIVFSGCGAAGTATAKLLLKFGAKDIIMCNRKGIIALDNEDLTPANKKLAMITNKNLKHGKLADAMVGADIFIGLSAGNLVTKEMVASMNRDAIVIAMANPIPEIMPNLAKEGGAKIVGTGRSDYPNQVNNVLAFPGVFRGVLDVRASDINDEMQLAAAKAIASLVSDDELSTEYILPKAFDSRVCEAVAKAVSEEAVKTGVARL